MIDDKQKLHKLLDDYAALNTQCVSALNENDKLREALELAIDDVQEIKDIAATSLKPDNYITAEQFLKSRLSNIEANARRLLLALEKAV